ncbi:hypothetical protein ACFL5O_02615 [Myxococcota bacterium]
MIDSDNRVIGYLDEAGLTTAYLEAAVRADRTTRDEVPPVASTPLDASPPRSRKEQN